MPGVHSHLSAARVWGLWIVADAGREHRTVPRNYGHRPADVVLHFADLAPEDVCVRNGVMVTTLVRTVVDLARLLPEHQALPVADSALKLHRLDPLVLRDRASAAKGKNVLRIRWVARHTDARSGSPLESEARARLLVGRIGPLQLQHRLRADGHPYDLYVEGTRLLIEIDGRWHSEEERHRIDAEDLVDAGLEGHELQRFTAFHVRRRHRWMVAVVAAKAAEHRARRRRERAKDRAARSRARADA